VGVLYADCASGATSDWTRRAKSDCTSGRQVKVERATYSKERLCAATARGPVRATWSRLQHWESVFHFHCRPRPLKAVKGPYLEHERMGGVGEWGSGVAREWGGGGVGEGGVERASQLVVREKGGFK
jgi:hypothetical protein